VGLLRSVPAAEQSEVVGEIEKDDPELGAALRSRLFTFDDLIHLADRDMQTLIREIDMTQLTVALKGAPPAVKERFMKNMSTRAGQMLEDEISAMGPVKLAAVEPAQPSWSRLRLAWPSRVASASSPNGKDGLTR